MRDLTFNNGGDQFLSAGYDRFDFELGAMALTLQIHPPVGHGDWPVLAAL